MADLHTRESAYASTRRRNLMLAVGFGAVSITLWLLWAKDIIYGTAFDHPLQLKLLHLVVFVVTGWLATHFWQNYRKTASGDTGVERSLDILSELPDGYHVFSNLHVEGAFIGTVVVGRNGVFIINTKNHNGEITPSDDYEWTQKKVGRGGTEYTATLRNPVKQTKKQIYSMSQFLKKNNIRAWVDGIVYFTNPDLILNGTGDAYTNKGRAVLEFILDYPVRTPLDDSTVDRIVRLF